MKNKSEKISYNSFLPSHLAILKTPPSYLVVSVAVSISIGILIAIIWSYIGKLDIQATAQGKLIVSGQTQLIQAFELSRLQHIHVADGQTVKQGDALLSVKVLGIDQDILSLNYQQNFQISEKLIHYALLNEQPIEALQSFVQLNIQEKERAIQSYQSIKKEYNSLRNEIDNEIELNRVSY
ncbi:MAG: hypothetical protein PV362_08525 [Providencia heimbachae]|nr:hypothetical protein [Providencia heimbachae]